VSVFISKLSKTYLEGCCLGRRIDGLTLKTLDRLGGDVMLKDGGIWQNAGEINPRQFICGFCGNNVASKTGYFYIVASVTRAHIVICPFCRNPTFFDTADKQFPGAKYGRLVEHVPTEIERLYKEAKDCYQVNASTGCVLCCRALLMHIAVEHGAIEGLGFVEYIDHIVSHGLIPIKSKPAADAIRQSGNKATHRIAPVTMEEAQKTLYFLEILLMNIYEIEGKTQKSSTP